MKIRRAQEKDIDRINELLYQVCMIHHRGRPDLFRAGARKYSRQQLVGILHDEKTPVFAAVDDDDRLMGYAFCMFRETCGDNILQDVRTLYIDDLCVDESLRGKGIGKALYRAVREFALEHGCYNLTLNVWSCNTAARAFYERCGFVPQKTVMEEKLRG